MDRGNPDKTVLSRYFTEIRGYPLLTKEQEQQLARRVRTGDKEAFEHLVASNLSFVVKVASEYRNLGLPLEDLLNEGNLGLIEAARRYDPAKGTKFITYAIWWIRKSCLTISLRFTVRSPSDTASSFWVTPVVGQKNVWRDIWAVGLSAVS